MEYKEYLKKLGETALRYAELPDDNGKEEDLEPEPKIKISGDIEKDITFDGSGDATFEYSKYCPANIDITAWIFDSPNNPVFDAYIDTNYPEHKKFSDITLNQKISTTIKTNTFSSTTIKVRVHSNKPNSTAKFHLHYDV